MIIRPAEPKDAYEIAVVHVKTWQHAYKGQLPDDYLASLSIEQRAEMWTNILAKQEKNSHCLVAENEGVIVAWCSVGKNRDSDMADNTGELWGIYVLPEYNARGIGSKLMQKGLSLLKEEGFAKATLWVLSTNEKSKAWYESRGWKCEGGIKTESRFGLELNEVRYITDL